MPICLQAISSHSSAIDDPKANSIQCIALNKRSNILKCIILKYVNTIRTTLNFPVYALKFPVYALKFPVYALKFPVYALKFPVYIEKHNPINFWSNTQKSLSDTTCISFQFPLSYLHKYQHLTAPISTYQHFTAPISTYQHLTAPICILHHLSAPYNTYKHLTAPISYLVYIERKVKRKSLIANKHYCL